MHDAVAVYFQRLSHARIKISAEQPRWDIPLTYSMGQQLFGKSRGQPKSGDEINFSSKKSPDIITIVHRAFDGLPQSHVADLCFTDNGHLRTDMFGSWDCTDSDV